MTTIFDETTFINCVLNDYYQNNERLREIFDEYYELFIGSNTEREILIRNQYPNLYFTVIINGVEIKRLVSLQFILYNKIDHIVDQFGDSEAETVITMDDD